MNNTKKDKVMKKHAAFNIVAIVLLLAGVLVVVTLFWTGNSESTDDAEVEQYISPINVRVSGYIREIRFQENQFVHKGDTLLIIDDREYAIALKQAEAALMEARSGRKVMGHSVNTAANSATVYDANIAEAEVKVAKLQRDYNRYYNLLQKKASTPVIVEQYKTELDMARARLDALRRQRQTALSTVSEASQRQQNGDAAILKAEAAVDMARLNLSYTVVTAPADGCLGRRNIETGQLVSPGQTITTLIPDTRKWIVANFKEKQMSRIQPGQQVEISIDAFPHRDLVGKVSSVSSATGSKYSMVPTDNSAGNFVKIQQRVPVRIDITDNLSVEENRRLAAGMMCVVKVKVK
jgi:membrane fusion protein (multidrug efflux system)